MTGWIERGGEGIRSGLGSIPCSPQLCPLFFLCSVSPSTMVWPLSFFFSLLFGVFEIIQSVRLSFARASDGWVSATGGIVLLFCQPQSTRLSLFLVSPCILFFNVLNHPLNSRGGNDWPNVHPTGTPGLFQHNPLFVFAFSLSLSPFNSSLTFRDL